jgi:hypothetical protein
MDPVFTPPSSEQNTQFTQHLTRPLSHLDLLCVYYPSQEATPSTLPIIIIVKIGGEANHSAIMNFRTPDAMFVHKSYLPSFPEFFSVSYQHQFNPFATFFEIILHPRFVALGKNYMVIPEGFLPVLDPRSFNTNQYQSESDIPYLMIPDPRFVTPKYQYNLNPNFPWSIQTITYSGRFSNIGRASVGTQYHFASYALYQWNQFKLKKKLERTYICAACRAKLSGQNYQMHLSSHPKKEKNPSMIEQIKKEGML